MKKQQLIWCCLIAALLAFGTTPSFAQDGPGDGDPKEAGADDSKGKKKEKGYTDIITEDAISDEGLFTVHKVEDKYYFELPKSLMEREILVVSRISGHVKNLNFGGAGMRSRPQQVIRWQEMDGHLLLRSVSYNSVATQGDPIYESVKNNNYEPIIERFKVATQNEDSTAYVIDVTKFFSSDVPMLGPMTDGQRKAFKIKGLDNNRSFIKHIKAYPSNVEVRQVLTYRGDELPDNQITESMTIEMNQSFIELPEEPWQPRYYDDRVGYFSLRQTDYSLDEQKAATKRFITRWRLDPVDMDAYKRGELVAPKKPIVYYIDPATPEKWRPYLKKGVEDWQAVFEKAGFKNAIIAKDPPSKEEDPEWSPEDVRYSVIRYVSTDIQNAMGPHVHDPRTGEILESDIIWYHNVMNLLRNWFLIQTAAVYPDARKVKFDDELMGELIRFVAAHEVGHTLGLPHNMGSSVAYPVDSLRAPGFVQRMGVAPSIMDYARFNYVAQPEDKGAGVMPKIGPYDEWSIIYGYKLVPEAASAEEERPVLNEWIKSRDDDPIYRYGQQQWRVVDPSAQTEDIGSDAVEASDLGIANLKRIVPNLITWTARDGEDYEDLSEIYRQVAGQFRRYVGHVGNNIGGVYEYDKTYDQEGIVYTHVPKDKQRAAVNFLNRQLFATPTWMIDQDIIGRVGSTVIVDLIRGLQDYGLNLLFTGSRLERMMENEALNGNQAYTMSNLFEDTRRSIFAEIGAGSTPDAYRRNLQRAYISQMGSLLMAGGDVDISDAKAIARMTLETLKADIAKAAKRADGMQGAHLKDLLARIDMIEEGKMPGGASSGRNGIGQTPADSHFGCWHTH
ncbi:zinc-dependent metalloprotease [Phaeodactylibacter luteus]|uniref:Zinc-dependent metalloprotease n=1 Tax=Phaeodactylibacter luteus TaxID=1564516 RepID=A0A5C6S595_9BACT|nr:zinc-dependent metalloprotease [Phaeodactylibacter luteus]TXB69437.1 zinc-dependent metalloprotease [Phaeodactylibacter luteus]